MKPSLAWSGLAGLLGLPARARAAADTAAGGTATKPTPPAGGPDRIAVIRDRNLPNIPLVTHEGRRVRFYDDLVQGRVVAIHFMYARCTGVCLPSTEHLAQVQKDLGERMGRDVTFLSISLDGEKDTPESLKEFAREHGAGPGWLFLTGRRADIEVLRRKLGAYEPDPRIDADRSQHAALVILGNEPEGRWQAISALSHPVRIRQAIERTLLPPSQWPTGAKVVNEVPFEKSPASFQRVEPVDLSRLPPLHP